MYVSTFWRAEIRYSVLDFLGAFVVIVSCSYLKGRSTQNAGCVEECIPTHLVSLP